MERLSVDRTKLSPMMLQYMEIKDRYPDTLIFFRLGDFYELFFEDADVCSRELELTLTGKNAGLSERVPMCGVPHHSAKIYIEKLISKGYKVAICEQLEDPKLAKGMVKRDVIEVVTKGTMVDLEFLNEHDFNYIGTIFDYGYNYLIVYLDLSTGKVFGIFVPHNKTSLINEVLSLNLKEIIVENNFDIELINIFKNTYSISITINDLYLEDEYKNVYEGINDERIVKALKNIMYHLHVTQLKDLSHLSHIEMVQKDDYLNMDIHTIRNLELLETLRLKERKFSLLWLLDKTKTAMGSRTLKSWLMNPLKDETKINKRLDYIESLNNNFLQREELMRDLYEVYDLERLTGKVICGSLNGRDLLQIKNSIKVIPDINRILNELKFDITLNTHEELFKLLESSISEDTPISIKEGGIIKSGYNAELDELKSIRSGGKDFISGIEAKLKEETGINNLKVGYNKVFGYFIEVSKGNSKRVSEELGWERRQTLTNAERYITPELKEKEALVLNAEERIIDLEYNIFMEIKESVKGVLFELKETATLLSEIDSLCSLSLVSEEHHLIRPKFNNNHNLRIIDGRHPVVEVVSNNNYVKNDVIMDESTSTLLITGPNMSGKSTYMRELAIIIIMAQMGSFVPAAEANLPIFDSIYTRIGASDDLVSGESTFMVEMIEAKNAIVNATENSLILFDELGRGTATFDGMSLARAILEYVNLKIKCKTLFSTHYHELTDLSDTIPSIKNVHVDAIEEDGKVTFLHKVKEGPIDKSYGIHVARLAGLPEDLLKRASEFLASYESYEKREVFVQQSLNFEEKHEDNKLEEKIKEIDILKMTPMDAINFLYELKNTIK
ncbi:dNA mismatch repair protein MutS [Firmicutes bacterium CAG:582]|nr:dNA mismatch repair protein MutS [Firmicutes bacterium CAG:582]